MTRLSFKSDKIVRSGAIDRVGGAACNANPRDQSLHYELF
jgi:hypothetical protein